MLLYMIRKKSDKQSEQLSSRCSTLLLLAHAMSSGKPLLESLEIAHTANTYPPFSRCLMTAIALLQDGNSAFDTFAASTLADFPGKVRVILSSDLPDQEKGFLLAGYVKSQEIMGPNLPASLVHLLTSSAIWGLSCTALVMFAFPQFREIFLGTGIPMPWLLALITSLADFIFYAAVGIVGLLVFIVSTTVSMPSTHLLERLFARMTGKTGEWVTILEFLADLEWERRFPALRLVAVPALFPLVIKELVRFNNHFAQRTHAGVQALPSLPPVVAWCLVNALQMNCSGDSLRRGAAFLKCRSWNQGLRWVTIIQILGYFVLGFATLVFTAALFQGMIAILENTL